MEIEFCELQFSESRGDKWDHRRPRDIAFFSNYEFKADCKDNISSAVPPEIDPVTKKYRVAIEDIAGLLEAKAAIFEAVVFPLKYPNLFNSRLAAPPRGVLLYGPPGTGKTMLAKWVACCSGSTFYSLSAASIMSKWIGESEKSVRAVFETARINQPSVIFIDEIDCILGKRSESDHEATRRLKNEFLVSLDGVDTDFRDHIVVIGATNIPGEIDEAALRRFAKKIYIPLPCAKTRRELIHRELVVYARESNTEWNSFSDMEWVEIVGATDGYSGSDIKCVLQEAVMVSLRQVISGIITSIRPVDIHDIRDALNSFRPKCVQGDSDRFET